MLIKLTNSNPEFKGDSVLLNTDCIVSVFRKNITRKLADDSTLLEDVTFVHCPPHGTWEVEETVEQILEMVRAG